MRRTGGTSLVPNEMRVLAASLRLTIEGVGDVYGYDLVARLADWEDQPAMTRSTLYRCLHALAARGLYRATPQPGSRGPDRTCYTLTQAGLEGARRAVVVLAASDHPPAWLDLRDALPPARPAGR